MQIVVTGGRGQLGWELGRQLGERALLADRETLDISDRKGVFSFLKSVRPGAVVNSAAYTAVDKAQQEPDLCQLVNAEAVGYLAEACQELGCPLVQVSTDYVFGAPSVDRRPRREEDPTSPQGVYAWSKLAGEEQAQRAERHIVVRTCGLYGRAAPGRRPNNFVETMLRLGAERDRLRIVDDQYCTPSYVRDVARAILFLLAEEQYGTYHITNHGATNWAGFAAEIFRQAKLDVEIEPITTSEYGAPAPRPSFSVLDTSKYDRLGGPRLPDWQEALAEYLIDRGNT
jgi:dTDP-4-dehydrorhamnose reductase